MIYILAGGMMLYSETAKVRGDQIEFKPRETCMLMGTPARGGQTQLQIMRCDKQAWKMTKLTIERSAVQMFHDVTDQQILASIKSELSGLIIPVAN